MSALTDVKAAFGIHREARRLAVDEIRRWAMEVKDSAADGLVASQDDGRQWFNRGRLGVVVDLLGKLDEMEGGAE